MIIRCQSGRVSAERRRWEGGMFYVGNQEDKPVVGMACLRIDRVMRSTEAVSMDDQAYVVYIHGR